MARLIHFKCTFDQNWSYENKARQFFGDNQCLVMSEKEGSNHHVHFQGYTTMLDSAVQRAIAGLSIDHYLTKLYADRLDAYEASPVGDKPKKPRPVKMHKRKVDEVGFQYICKEGKPPLFKQGFSDEDILELKRRSDVHVEELKTGLKEHLFAREYPAEPAQAFKRMREDSYDYYMEGDKRPRPQFQKDVLWAMAKHPFNVDQKWKDFICERL